MSKYLKPEFVSDLQKAEQNFTWRGVRCVKNPFDFQIMSMLLWREHPKTIIEVGSNTGGSALWMHDLMALYGFECKIYSVDRFIPDLNPPAGLKFIKGDGRRLNDVFSAQFMSGIERPLLIIEDADHSEETSYSVLQFWLEWSHQNEMIVVEDGVPCPEVHTAIDRFINEQSNKVEIDRNYCDFFGQGVTLFKNGYIRRVGNTPIKKNEIVFKIKNLVDSEKYEEADILCDQAISRGEFLGDVFICKARIKADNNDHEEAIDFYNKSLDSGYHEVSILRYFLSLSQFSVGNYKEGWQNLFLSRLENTTFKPLYAAMRRFVTPLKQLFVMQPPPVIVHIHADAGEGDNIAFLRYLPILAEKGYKVRYEARDGMLKLAQGSLNNVEVIPLANDFPGISGLPEFDYHLPIAIIPFIFQTELDTIPWSGPYIKTDPELVAKYKSCKGKIGICWSTGPVDVPEDRYCRRKSISFELLKPIIDIDPDMFVALQAGSARVNNIRIIDPMLKNERLLTWAETAAIIENLDLVITVDTAVAHLAGAMGKPTWLMMHKYLTSWQFMAECPGASWNTNSPWYPSMRIFRQKSQGNWNSVVNDVVSELESKLIGDTYV